MVAKERGSAPPALRKAVAIESPDGSTFRTGIGAHSTNYEKTFQRKDEDGIFGSGVKFRGQIACSSLENNDESQLHPRASDAIQISNDRRQRERAKKGGNIGHKRKARGTRQVQKGIRKTSENRREKGNLGEGREEEG